LGQINIGNYLTRVVFKLFLQMHEVGVVLEVGEDEVEPELAGRRGHLERQRVVLGLRAEIA
jgi:hypothetical protein